MAAGIPAVWADALDKHTGRSKPLKNRAEAVRNGLRLWLQHEVTDPDEWRLLDLGPIPEKATYPDEVIEGEAWEEDAPVLDTHPDRDLSDEERARLELKG
ncbi:MAG: hypothetical protein JST59_16195 [Actinobacteria bacterium]|nr:hypothetical protein [Actinomycetota bacterium]